MSDKLPTEVLMGIVRDVTEPSTARISAAQLLLQQQNSQLTTATTIEMPTPWYKLSIKELTMFFLRATVALIPAVLLIYVLWMLTFLAAVFTTQVLQ